MSVNDTLGGIASICFRFHFQHKLRMLANAHPWVCIRSDLKPLETDISDSSYCAIKHIVGRYLKINTR